MNLQNLIKEQTNPEWQELLLAYPNFDEMNVALQKEYQTYEPHIKILPYKENIFNAFKKCPYSKLKVIQISQDPYFNMKINKNTGEMEPEANGLAFSVNEGLPVPPSLKNLIKEMQDDIGVEYRSSDFSNLASQGILFLNAALTVRQHMSNSHAKIWRKFTNWVIEQISKEKEGIVFILLGKYAQGKAKFIDTKKHHLIEEVHPSPLSAFRGFFGSKIYSKCNTFLIEKGQEEIEW